MSSNFVSGASLGASTTRIGTGSFNKTGAGSFMISSGSLVLTNLGTPIPNGTTTLSSGVLTLNPGTTTGNFAALGSNATINFNPGITALTNGAITTSSGILMLNPGITSTGAATSSGAPSVNSISGGVLTLNGPTFIPQINSAGPLQLGSTAPTSGFSSTGTSANGVSLGLPILTAANGINVANATTGSAGALIVNPLSATGANSLTTSTNALTAPAPLTTTSARTSRLARVGSDLTGAAGAAPVPEPSSAALALFGALVFARRRAFRA